LFVCIEASRENPQSQQALDRAQSLVAQLEKEQEDPGEDSSKCGALTRPFYDALVQIHANRAGSVYGAAAAAEDALLRLSHLSATRDLALQPTSASFNRVLQAWSACPETNGADRAHEILKLQLSLGPPASPDAVSFGTVITAYGRRERPDDAERVWWSCVQYLGGTGGENGIVDLTGCFQALVAAWSRVRFWQLDDDADSVVISAVRIRDLIRSVVYTAQGSFVVRDTAVIHSCLIQALVREGEVLEASEYLEEIIERCWTESGPVPTAGTFHMIFHGWTKTVESDPSQASLAAQKVMQLLNHMMSLEASCPTESVSFSLATDVLYHATAAACAAHESDSEHDAHLIAQRFMEVLDHAEQRRQSTAGIYHRMVHSMCRIATFHSVALASDVLNRYHEQARQRPDVEWIPDRNVGLYTTVIAALVRLRTTDAAERALDLLRSMTRLGTSQRGRSLLLVPNRRTYTCVLQAFAPRRNERSAQVAQEIYEEVRRVDAESGRSLTFDEVAFTMLLKAAGLNAELSCEIFSYMMQLQRLGRLKLTRSGMCSTAVVKSLVRSGFSPELADRRVDALLAGEPAGLTSPD
jgi:pentatricopeptide repeat protein